MTDCPNAEMRDRLPDLLHERLDKAARAVVEAHVENCADCRAELTLLREALVALTSHVRSVDVTTIAGMVVQRTRMAAVAPSRSRQRASWRTPLLNWRVAASVAVLVVGGGSLWLARGMRATDPTPGAVSVPSVAAPYVGATASAAAPPIAHQTSMAASSPRAELSAGGEVSDLSETDLRTLLRDLDGMDAVPSAEPEPVVVRVSLPGSGGSE